MWKTGRRRATTSEPAADNHPDTDADDPADDAERGPLRRCIITRERLPKEAMIRCVIGPDRAVVPDLAARLPGRGIWLSARGDVLDTARVQGKLAGHFARAARGPVRMPPDLLAVLQAGLARRFGDTLGLARRAGQAVAGFQKAREWLRAGRVGLIVQAADGSTDERARLLGHHGTGNDAVPVVTPLDAAALGALFGRDHVVHVAVAPGRLAEALRTEAARLAGLMAPAGAVPAGQPAGAKEQDIRRPDGSAADQANGRADG
jgi:predicted RNA-binding protein YlxR (DUF448 family)/ribosomal protein L7Ae-like RNA K-turn-binding protein